MYEMIKIILKLLDEIEIENYSQETEKGLNKQLSLVKNVEGGDYSDQYAHLLGNLQLVSIYQDVRYRGNTVEQQKMYEDNVKAQMDYLRNSLEVMMQLEPFARVMNKNIILVGANGSGKSSFANFLKEQSIWSNIAVIPAQKYLYMTNNNRSDEYTPEKIRNKQGKLKLKNQEMSVSTYGESTLHDLFNNLLVAMINDETQTLLDNKNKEVPPTIFDEFKGIFGQLFLGITFDVDVSTRTLIPIKYGEKYNLNAMSDGEKVAIYYILNILIADKDSYIIIDEPETFLNPNISSKLWDSLEVAREDCQFIYVTHNVEFINSRSNATLFWLRDANIKASQWKIDKVEDVGLPKDLFISLLGNRKKILFCEGNGKSSLDYQVYEKLFGDKFTICPVGGCEDVKKSTKTYNASHPDIFNNKAIGIVDFDLLSMEEIGSLKKNKIFVNKYANEIEMVLFLPEILESTIGRIFPEISSELIEQFKSKMIAIVLENKERIVLQKAKKVLERKLATEKLEQFKTKDDLKECFLNLFTETNFEDVFLQIEEVFKEIIDDKNIVYEDCLRVCSLKGEISRGLSAEIFKDKAFKNIDYIESAIVTLKNEQGIIEIINEKYYKDICSDLTN